MSIRRRVEDAILLYREERYEGAFLNILVAIAASARREIPNRKIGDRDCFEQFLEKRWRGILKVEYRGECHPIPHIFYKWFRCELLHEGGLPVDIEFIKSQSMSVRAGGAPEFVLKISHGWFHWLLQSVIQAPRNAEEFTSFKFPRWFTKEFNLIS
jgi:hypothetical protein